MNMDWKKSFNQKNHEIKYAGCTYVYFTFEAFSNALSKVNGNNEQLVYEQTADYIRRGD